MYRYETHLHTSPVSKCARATVRETLEFYKSKGYDGVFLTNHFLDGNINIDGSLPYEEKVKFYLSDYEEAKKLEAEIGIKVFFGVEISYGGTDFLIYGLDGDWYLSHPEIMDMKKSDELQFMRENGAFVIQAHPYREAKYIDHIRLYPRSVDGVEVINASNNELVNSMAKLYAENYGLLKTAGSDNHVAGNVGCLAGIETEQAIDSVDGFIEAVKSGAIKIFCEENM